jgi:pimeloyl-ACP methyl ester carboxylesterase
MFSPVPIVLIGGFGFDWRLYRPVRDRLAIVSQQPVAIAPINSLEWLQVMLSNDYSGLLRALHSGILDTLRSTHRDQLQLIAHSAGGVLARIYLGDQPYGDNQTAYHGTRYVSRLVTLGTPHWTTRAGRRAGQTQIAFANQHYPGAFHPTVNYASVGSRAILGNRQGSKLERSASEAYGMLSEDSEVPGDGIIPLENALLAGGQQIVMDDLRHDRRDGHHWYGQDVATIRRWWEQLAM